MDPCVPLMSLTDTIEIAVTCTWFQRRLCWMMSSVLQQKGKYPHIRFNVAYPVGNGDPATESVCEFFRKQGLDIKETPYPDQSEIQFRGLVRNRQLMECRAEWILFSDADMTFHPHFFELLPEQMEEHPSSHGMWTYRRTSLDKEFCLDVFKSDLRKYPCIINNAGRLRAWPKQCKSKNNAAGYYQLVNVSDIMSRFGCYVDPADCNDRPWDKGGQKAWSDRQFALKVGGYSCLHYLPLYHLNHRRDHVARKHLEIQR